MENLSTDLGDREFVRSLAKGLAVIETFGPGKPWLTLSEVARRTAISPGSARRVLLTLQRLGYVGSDGQRFCLQPRALQLGYAYLSSLPLTPLVQPRLAQLAQDIGESCSLALLDGDDVVYVGRAASRRLTQDYMSVGVRFPAHATSVGKVLLAELGDDELGRRLHRGTLPTVTTHGCSDPALLMAQLTEVRRQGWALNDQETILGLRSIAVPVRVDGQVIASLGMSTEVTRTSIETMRTQFLPALQDAAATLAELLSAAGVVHRTALSAGLHLDTGPGRP